jgi:hypothetical protein
MYLSQILQDYNKNIQAKLSPEIVEFQKNAGLEVSSILWFRHYNYRLALVPGILAFLVTLIGGMLTALNIVSEKEVGTMEQINVSPIKKYNFILGKLIPFWILAMIAFTLGLLVSRFVYSIEINGNLLLLYFFSHLFVCDFRFWFADFHVQRNASNKQCLRYFSFDDFQFNERIVYANRKYANLGAENDKPQSFETIDRSN